MSIYGALFAGVSGLEAQSNALSVISNNIANVNTVGFKGATGLFESLVTSSAGAAFAPGGVLGIAAQDVDTQGQLQSTSSPTDIAISGTGFFVVNQDSNGAGQVLYTRAGDFTQDSTGNFVNSAGFYLQAWPLDRNGLLPGQPGNLDTTSSANLSSLETVNVENVTGTASPTTTVAIGANLESSQTPLAGSGVTASHDATDSVNNDNTANDFIAPTSVDSLTNGDSFKITTGTGSVDQTYTYGGYTVGRNVTSGAPATVLEGGSDVALSALGGTSTLTDPPFTLSAIGDDTTTFTVAAASNDLANGDTVVLSGNSEDIAGIPAADFNGTFVVSNVTADTYDITVPATATTTTTAADITLSTAASSSTTITVHQVGSDMQSGDKVTIAGAAALGGFGTGDINGTFTVTRIDADDYSYTASGGTWSSAATESPTSVTNIAGAGTIIADTRLFTGNILNASSASDTFLGGLSTSDFTDSALTFTITTPDTGTTTFTYTAGSPNSQIGQFNTLDNLATAISDTNGLTARVYNNQLYVSAIDADDQITFANGSTTGIVGPPSQSGIDWVNELGLQTTVASGTNRFSTLQGLANVINATTGLTATVNDAEGDANVTIDVNDPLDTITFTDTPVGVGAGKNTGDPLAVLGITPSLAGVTPTTGVAATTGALGPAYSPTNVDENMASGSTTPQFSRPVQVYDALGTAHNLDIGFVNTGVNTWAVEVYAQPATDVSNGNSVTSTTTDGQLASGTITFNGDGSLASVSSSLTDAIPIDWTDGSIASSITINWGTAGEPTGTAHATAIGETNGLSQFNSSYHVNFVNQNGAPVGQLTGVSIGQTGIITASYSNGETQNLYQIPLAEFADPDALNTLTGNVYSQSEGSGEVNLVQSGTSGSGSISSSSLEASNVELANELTTMIVAQRSYEANTKVISTADQLLEDLNQIVGQ